LAAVRTRIGSLVAVVASEPLSDDPAVLSIQASLNSHSFAFTGSDSSQHTLSIGEMSIRETR